jgi:hypothetical protein
VGDIRSALFASYVDTTADGVTADIAALHGGDTGCWRAEEKQSMEICGEFHTW